MSGSVLAWTAVILLAAEPLGPGVQSTGERSLVMQLCDGGEITITLDDEGEDEPSQHCPGNKACHAGNCRPRFDLGQRPTGE